MYRHTHLENRTTAPIPFLSFEAKGKRRIKAHTKKTVEISLQIERRKKSTMRVIEREKERKSKNYSHP